MKTDFATFLKLLRCSVILYGLIFFVVQIFAIEYSVNGGTSCFVKKKNKFKVLNFRGECKFQMLMLEENTSDLIEYVSIKSMCTENKISLSISE